MELYMNGIGFTQGDYVFVLTYDHEEYYGLIEDVYEFSNYMRCGQGVELTLDNWEIIDIEDFKIKNMIFIR